MMPVKPEELDVLRRVKSFIPPCKIYTAGIVDTERAISQDDVAADSRVLLEVIALQYKGEPDWHEDKSVDWLAKANSMLPAAFSQLFDGEENLFSQRISRDMKLMDAVFEMGLAVYNRTHPKHPFDGWAQGQVLDGPRGMQKLVHVALQMMFKGNEDSQNYFSRRSSAVVSGVDPSGFKVYDDKNWMTGEPGAGLPRGRSTTPAAYDVYLSKIHNTSRITPRSDYGTARGPSRRRSDSLESAVDQRGPSSQIRLAGARWRFRAYDSRPWAAGASDQLP